MERDDVEKKWRLITLYDSALRSLNMSVSLRMLAAGFWGTKSIIGPFGLVMGIGGVTEVSFFLLAWYSSKYVKSSTYEPTGVSSSRIARQSSLSLIARELVEPIEENERMSAGASSSISNIKSSLFMVLAVELKCWYWYKDFLMWSHGRWGKKKK
jgi:hypothetical protein